MTHTPHIPPEWVEGQKKFEAMKATWSPERVAEDEARLQEILALAASTPTGQEALDWAKSHGVKFFIDRKVTNAGGYYSRGTGVVALAGDVTDLEYTVGTIVHEVRHAWQDYYGLLDRSAAYFVDHYIATSVIEADAAAWGEKARSEIKIARFRNQALSDPDMGETAAIFEATLADPNLFLRNAFLSWYNDRRMTGFYGHDQSNDFGRYLGILPPVTGGLAADHHQEFFGGYPIRKKAPDFSRIESIIERGRGFSGTDNYLAGMDHDILLKKILRPSLANTFWGAANYTQRRLTADIRKAELRSGLFKKGYKF